jgi:hypothetical protein
MNSHVNNNLPPPKAENEALWVRQVGFNLNLVVLVHEPVRIKQLWFRIHPLVPSHRPSVAAENIRAETGDILIYPLTRCSE